MPNFSQSQHGHIVSEESSSHRASSMVLLLLVSFVIGLCLSTVTWGAVLIVDDVSAGQDEFTLPALKMQVEDALGLPVATIQATFERPLEGEVPFPWRNQMEPVIRIALPQHWVSNRATMQGSQFLVLEEVRHIASLAVPSARIELHVVPQLAVSVASNEQPLVLGKQIVVLCGLVAMFCATCFSIRRKGNVETVSYNPLFDASSEASRILQMDYVDARQAIDRLHGHRRQEVLHYIASNEEELIPIVEVSAQEQLARV